MLGGPLLSLEQQINHCKAKGITFNSCDEDTAKFYLQYHNTYYRIRSYRKNFIKK